MACFRYLMILIMAAFVTVVHAQSPIVRPPVAGAPAGITAFVDVNIVPMDTERVIAKHTVLIESGRITALGPTRQVQVPPGVMRIDGRSKYLIPGLADMHAHVLPGDDSARTEHRLFRWLADGVTTVRNMDHGKNFKGKAVAYAPLTLRLRARAAAGMLWSPRIYTSGPSGISWRTPVGEVATLVAAHKAAGYDFLKVKGLGEEGAVLDSIAAAAHRIELPFAGHIPTGLMIEEAAATGYASIEHLEGLYKSLMHGRWLVERGTPMPKVDSAFLAWQRTQLDTTKIPVIAAAFRRAGVWNCPTQAIYETFVLEGGRSGVQKDWCCTNVVLSEAGGSAGARRQMIRALQDSGAGLLLGVDAAGWNEHLTVHDELQALVRAGLTPYEALATGTRNVAVFLGGEDETGTVARGKRADLVLLRGNPLDDIRNTMQPAGVMIGGRWLARAELDRRLAANKKADGE